MTTDPLGGFLVGPPLPDMEALAISLAARAHAGQDYGRHSYMVHLVDVARCVEEFDFGDVPELLAAAWLHDAVEDTPVTVEQIAEWVDEGVARIVAAVTDEPGETREERKAKTLPKIRRYGADAVFVKLCDRIANVRRCEPGTDRARMYVAEHAEFKRALFDCEDAVGHVWAALDGEMRALSSDPQP